MNELMRLLWALPLVIAVGAGAMVLLRRFVVPVARDHRDPHGAPRMRVCETLPVSEQTRVHLLDVDGSRYLVMESTQSASLQPLQVMESTQNTALRSLQMQPLQVQPREATRFPARSQPAWLRYFSGAAR
jgi:flagellar biogenesis protein FliO